MLTTAPLPVVSTMRPGGQLGHGEGGAMTLKWNARSKKPSLVSMAARGMAPPALLTAMSRRPNSVDAPSRPAAGAGPGRSRRSAPRVPAGPSPRRGRPPPRDRSGCALPAPRRHRPGPGPGRGAMPRPMPSPAPVTTATRSSRRKRSRITRWPGPGRSCYVAARPATNRHLEIGADPGLGRTHVGHGVHAVHGRRDDAGIALQSGRDRCGCSMKSPGGPGRRRSRPRSVTSGRSATADRGAPRP